MTDQRIMLPLNFKFQQVESLKKTSNFELDNGVKKLILILISQSWWFNITYKNFETSKNADGKFDGLGGSNEAEVQQ